ncbi:DUF427 domain-containing protein [Streptomyces nigra]|uniref:DUF427 domain-containing protein n=1 Tax=Streptomyces nigra TaxID=1827580 RepID=UPI00367A897A
MTQATPDYPQLIVPLGHVEPVPRRIRGFVGGRCIFDTVRAKYLWLWPGYPQYCVPRDEIQEGVLVGEGSSVKLTVGRAQRHALLAEAGPRRGAAWVWGDAGPAAVSDHVTFRWESVDAWFEEDEQVFVHPRSPYTRVDALRSSRGIRIELDGTVVADAPVSVMVFETGLPTRYYLDRVHIDWSRMVASDTVTSCPYKGQTSEYWSVNTDVAVHTDVAWAYDFPTYQLAAIAGMVAFYDEAVDVYRDGQLMPRPKAVDRALWEKQHRG